MIEETAKDIIEKGNKWFKKKIEEGWEMTSFGLLSFEDIKKADFIFNEKDQIWKISYTKVDGKIYLSEKFLSWYNNRESKPETIDEKIEKKQQEIMECEKVS